MGYLCQNLCVANLFKSDREKGAKERYKRTENEKTKMAKPRLDAKI